MVLVPGQDRFQALVCPWGPGGAIVSIRVPFPDGGEVDPQFWSAVGGIGQTDQGVQATAMRYGWWLAALPLKNPSCTQSNQLQVAWSKMHGPSWRLGTALCLQLLLFLLVAGHAEV